MIFVCSENELFTEIGNEIIVSITIEAPLMSEFYINNLICGRFIPTVHPRGHQFSEKNSIASCYFSLQTQAQQFVIKV